MTTQTALEYALDDLLADLRHARRNEDLGRLALLAYCEVRGWARRAGKADISQWATKMFTENPSVSREEFLASIDTLIGTLECHRQSFPVHGVAYGCADAKGCSHPPH